MTGLDIMIDIETLGVRAGCQVLSAGAVAFTRYRHTPIVSKHLTFEVETQLKAGLVAEPDTVEWWNSQPEVARKKAREGQVSTHSGLLALARFIRENSGPETRFWSQGNNFDFPILEACYHAMDIDEVPWAFWMCRDTRTVYDEHGFDPKWVYRQGPHHSAVHDALHQIECLAQARRWGRKSRLRRAIAKHLRGLK